LTTVVETIGPLLAIWIGAVVARRFLWKDKEVLSLSAGDVASLPVAWFAAACNIFSKSGTDQKVEPPQPNLPADSQVLTPDSRPLTSDS
jgi:hypothetical protein